MTGEHTPGPWKVASRKGGNDFSTDDVMTCTTPSRRIANVYGAQSTPESAANAQLIARAPQMAAELAALRDEVEILREAVLAAYRKGHHHTVNGGYQWCDQGGREVVEEIIREAGEEE